MSASGFETLKVLIVEDNQHMRALLRSLLNSLGIREVIEAGNGTVPWTHCAKENAISSLPIWP